MKFKPKMKKLRIVALNKIKDEGKITSKELTAYCKEKLRQYTIKPIHIGIALRTYLRKREIERWDSTIVDGGKTKKVIYYGVRGSRKTKRCVLCCREVDWFGPKVCPKCEPELEKIVNFYIPAWWPPDYSQSSRDRI